MEPTPTPPSSQQKKEPEVKPQEEKKPEKVEDKGDGDDEGVDDNYDPQEEVWINLHKKEILPEIKNTSGEENDIVLATFRVKMYRFRGGQWKERGVGEAKFLKAQNSNKVRLVARNDKTLRVIANFLLIKQGNMGVLKKLETAQNTWMTSAYDFSEETPKVETLAFKLTAPQFQRFRQEWYKAISVIYGLPLEISEQERDKKLEEIERKGREAKTKQYTNEEEEHKVNIKEAEKLLEEAKKYEEDQKKQSPAPS